jgi:hypothetical protein
MILVMENPEYLKEQNRQLEKYEALCRHCGVCCGAGIDPCANLVKGQDSRYYCTIYRFRIGQQKTVSGKSFNCVSIRDVLKFDPPNPDCAYIVKK